MNHLTKPCKNHPPKKLTSKRNFHALTVVAVEHWNKGSLRASESILQAVTGVSTSKRVHEALKRKETKLLYQRAYHKKALNMQREVDCF